MLSAATRAARTPGTRSWSRTRRTSSTSPDRDPLRGQDLRDRRRLRRRPAGTPRGDRRARGARRLDRATSAPLRQRAPDHAVARRDRPGERAAARRSSQIGTTRRGIGPATRTRRCGSGSASRTSSTRRSCGRRSRSRSPRRTSGSSASTASSRSTSKTSPSARGATRSGCARTSPTPRSSSTGRCRTARRCCFEGAQGTLLDLDHGTYPFVTSSNPIAGGAATGIGIGPHAHRPRARRLQGLRHARRRGPVPDRDRGRRRRRASASSAASSGPSTGRERRCGWLDLVALRYAVPLNGIDRRSRSRSSTSSRTSPSSRSASRYRLPDGTETDDFPAHQSDFHHCRAGVRDAAGLERAARRRRRLDDLPPAARDYVEFVERELDVEVSLIGTGADRASVLSRDQPAYSRS